MFGNVLEGLKLTEIDDQPSIASGEAVDGLALAEERVEFSLEISGVILKKMLRVSRSSQKKNCHTKTRQWRYSSCGRDPYW